MRRTILVTGATGYIGRYVVANLLEKKYNVIAFIRSTPYPPLTPSKYLRVVKGDITQKRTIVRALQSVDAVFHLAVNQYDASAAHKVNVGGMQNLVDAMRQMRVRRLINVSTQSAKIRQKGTYAATKAQGDEIAAQSGLDCTTLRLSLIYGPKPASVFQIIVHYLRTLPVVPVIGSGRWKLNPLFIEDAAEIMVRFIEHNEAIGKTYDVGCTKAMSFNDLLTATMRELHISKPILHIPFSVGFFAASLLQKVMKNPPIKPDYILGSNQDTNLNPRPALKTVRFAPKSVTKGLQTLFARPKKLHIAIIGLGKMGILHGAILTKLSERYPVDIVAVSDTNTSLAATAKSMGLSGTFYPSGNELLKNTGVDIAFVTTPTFTHKYIAGQLLARGIHTFVEKPLTTSLEDTRYLLAVSRQTRAIAGVGYFFSFRPTFHRFITLMKALKTQTRTISVQVKHGEVFGPKKGWLFAKRLSGGGVLINPASHAVSILVRALGKPQAVGGTMQRVYSPDIEDEASLRLDYKNGPNVDFFASWSIPNKPFAQTKIVARGSYGTIAVSDSTLTMSLLRNFPDLHLRKGPQTYEEMRLVPKDSEIFVLQKRAGGIGYYLQDEAFIQSVLQKKSFPNDFSLAYETEKVIHTVYAKL